MNFEEFDDFQSTLLQEVIQMKNTKGKEYAKEGDRFTNFNEDAKDSGLDRLVCAGVHLNKHMRAIKSFIRDRRVYSEEGIRGRIVDAITYLTLIAGMIEEDSQPKGNIRVCPYCEGTYHSVYEYQNHYCNARNAV